uniref:Uncharacterized protein n=1 Tax=Anguilla anguilla TaxID=7936 RepID=A0A0E9RNU6_ANGAN
MSLVFFLYHEVWLQK